MDATAIKTAFRNNEVQILSLASAGLAFFCMAEGSVLFFFPFFAAALIPAIHHERVTAVVERMEVWTRGRHWRITTSGSWWVRKLRFFTGPAVWMMDKVERKVPNRHVKAGLKLSTLCLLAVALLYIGVQLLILALFLLVLLLVAAFGGATLPSTSSSGRSSTAPAAGGLLAGAAAGAAAGALTSRKANPIVEQLKGKRIANKGFLIDCPTGLMIDDQGRLVEEGFFDRRTGYRIKDDGRIVKEGFFDTPLGLRIKEDGRIVKEGFFETPTKQRITDDGRLIKEGIFFDEDTGTRFK